MALDLSHDCTFTGPALPEPFVKFDLEAELNRLDLLPKTTGDAARALEQHWTLCHRKLREPIAHGGALRVQNHVIEPLIAPLGYTRLEPAEEVQTRERGESGGAILLNGDATARLRVWCTGLEEDLDAPARHGLAYRFSHVRIAQRVLLALASPAGVKALPDIIEKARLQQAKVTKDLRVQARLAIEEFIQEILDHPDNQEIVKSRISNLESSGGRGHEAHSSNPHSAESRGEVGKPPTSDL